MKILPVRELFKVTPFELVSGLRSDLVIRFEDNVDVEMTYREVQLLRFVIDIFLVAPDIKIESRHCFKNFYSNGILTAKTINKVFEVVLEDATNFYVRSTNNRRYLEKLYQQMYVIMNNIYNGIIFDALDYVNSIHIFDLLEVQMDNRLLDSMREVDKKKTVQSVNKTYEVLDDILRNKPELKENIISKGYIAGTMNANQIKQLLASRGYVTEINSHIFKYPIASSFTLGLSNIYDLAIESRAGAKALHLSNRAVQESEYFARELQLLTMIVEKLVDGDCGNKDYIEWLVRDKSVTGKCDLDNLLGKYYYNPDTKQEEVITPKHKYLDGKTILLRSSINCKLNNPRHICTKCFGDLSYTIPVHSNIGHFSATEITQKLTQSILSTKHLATSASSGESSLSEEAKQFFGMRENVYMFKSNLINKSKYRLQVMIDQFSGFGIKDLRKGFDIHKLNPTRVTRISDIAVMVVDKENGEVIKQVAIPIMCNRRYGYFPYEFLEFIVENGYSLDNYDRYIIDVTDFDIKKPFIVMPEVEYNFIDLLKNIKSLLRKIEIIKGVKSYDTPEGLLQKAFDMINTKLDVNIALIEVVIYAFTVKSLKDNDFRLGRNSEDRQLMGSKNLIANRSLGATYDWQEVVDVILSPKSYYGKNNISHPLDIMIKPNETLKDKGVNE